MRVLSSVALLVLAAALLVSCGGDGTATETSQEPSAGPEKRAEPEKMEEVVLTLAGRVGPESAGLVMAEHREYFVDEGLDVEILTPGSPVAPIDYVIDGVDDLGVSHQPEVMLALEQGAPIEVVGSLIPRPTATMIWSGKSGIRGIADLKGRTIAIPGLPFQRLLLERILARAGLSLGDVKVRAVEYDLVSSLVDGDADAIYGGSANVEGVELESAGVDPVVVPVGQLGIPAYEELVLFARTDFVKRNPQLIRGLTEAMRRGTVAAIEDPETAAIAIDSDYETVWGTGPREMEAEVEATLPLLSETGNASPARAGRLAAWMRSRAAGS